MYRLGMADLFEKRDTVRARLLDAIPESYSPWAHLAGTLGVGVATLAVGAWGLRDVKAWQLAAVPATLLIANFFEHAVHKHLLHHRRWPWHELFDRHTPEHHMVYHEHDMAIRDYRELKLVLIPAVGVLGIVLSNVPIALAFGKLLAPNVGYLFLVTSASYMVSYELMHLSYHLPEDHPIGRSRLVKWLRAHHAHHHDPKLMSKWNFNVTLPLADWVLGTTHHGEAKSRAPVAAAKQPA